MSLLDSHTMLNHLQVLGGINNTNAQSGFEAYKMKRNLKTKFYDMFSYDLLRLTIEEANSIRDEDDEAELTEEACKEYINNLEYEKRDVFGFNKLFEAGEYAKAFLLFKNKTRYKKFLTGIA